MTTADEQNRSARKAAQQTGKHNWAEQPIYPSISSKKKATA